MLLFTFLDFLKQESDGFVNKHSFPEFDDPTLETKALNHASKNCVSYGMNCYRTQSSEDSGTSGSPSPARALQVSCYGDATQRFEPGKGEQKDNVYCDTAASYGSRPKIWSLARTATSNSPPLIRRYQCPVDYCLDGGQKEDNDCTKMKPGFSCSVPYPDYTQDRTSSIPARKNPAEDLCCDRSVYQNVLPSCSVTTKCESTDCLGPSDRNSCMINSQCNYAAEYPTNLNSSAEHYPYSEKQFKNKDLCAIEYSTTKCQQLDGSVDSQTSKKMTSTIMPYPGSEPGGRNDFYSAGGGFEQTQNMGTLHKSAPNQTGIEIPDSGSLLRRNDH